MYRFKMSPYLIMKLVARQIIDNFNGSASKVVVSFAEIARASKAGGRKHLAAMVRVNCHI